MKLSEKLRYLRSVEGALRGLGRDLTQIEVSRAIKKELGATISQSYLSQLESGSRPHMTNTTRTVLARFYKIHPGYLVDDPEGFHYELTSDLPEVVEKLDLWLVNGADRFRRDPELGDALVRIARHEDSRKGLILLGAILDTPHLLDRLYQVLEPNQGNRRQRQHHRDKELHRESPRRHSGEKPGGEK